MERCARAIKKAQLPSGSPLREYLQALDDSDCKALGIIWPSYAYDKYRDIADDLEDIVATTLARAAIAAMEEPTEAMLKEGVRQDSEGGWSNNPDNIWPAMIRKALEE